MITDYPGARAVPLINREDILAEIRQAIEDPAKGTHIFYITGWGGYGKTYLVREVLARLKEGGVWAASGIVAAEREVDLYHAQTHSLEGLAQAILEALPAEAREPFNSYQKQYERLEILKPDLAVALRNLIDMRNQLGQAFLESFNRLTQQHRVVWALDTAEKLLYESDRIQEMLGLEEAGVGVRPWLINTLLPGLQNAVVLVAGRPKEPHYQRLRADLRSALGDRLHEHELKIFEEEDSLEYFVMAAQAARVEGDEVTARRIEAIPPETRRVIHRYAGGRPILLALLIDYYAATDHLLPELRASLEEAEARTSTEETLRQVQDKIEADIVRLIQETGRPADEAVRALAYTRKGMDARLLAHMIGIELTEAGQLLADLQKPPGLSFIKIRPQDQRIFLHDEMYDLLKRHVLDCLPEPQTKRMYSAVVDYYVEDLIPPIRQKLRLLEDLWRKEISNGRVTTTPRTELPFDITALADARQELANAIVEEVHYQLYKDPRSGFQTYYEYAEEAFRANNASLDMLLRDELLDFLSAPEYKDAREIDGLSRSVVEWDTGTRWIKRVIYYHGDHAEGLRIANLLRTKCSDLMMEVGPFADAELSAWEAWALAYQGRDLGEGEKRLREAIETLQSFNNVKDARQVWQCNILLAQAYNNLGYLYRVRGNFQRAITAYRQALPLWRATKFEAEHANTLNNLAWAYGESEDFSQAIRLVRDALELRRSLGPRSPVGLSLNTLGMILIRAEQPHPARIACEQALAIFRELEQPRGIGLACTALAEALRRLNSNLPELYFPEERAKILYQAEQYAVEAVDIFSNQLRQELSRRIEALIVLGSVQRDWAQLRPQYPSDADPDQAELAARAVQALRRASDEAPESLLHRKVEALVNLAWLYAYIDQPNQARSLLEKEVWPLIPTDYYITEAGLPRPGLPMAFLWVQLAKSHTLLGHLAFQDYRLANEEFKRTKKEEELGAARRHLRMATRDYTLGLAYDSYYRRDIRKVGRGHDRIYNDLKTLNLNELQIVLEEVMRTASEYQLGKETLMHTFLEQSFGPLDLQRKDMI